MLRAWLVHDWQALEELVGVAGSYWAIEECLEGANGQTGLDQYELGKWDGWYPQITMSMLAHAYLAVVRYRANALCSGKEGEIWSGMKLCPESRNPRNRLRDEIGAGPETVLAWSREFVGGRVDALPPLSGGWI